MITELFKEEEMMEIFITGAKKQINKPFFNPGEKKELLKSIDLAFCYCPVGKYMNELVELKRSIA